MCRHGGCEEPTDTTMQGALLVLVGFICGACLTVTMLHGHDSSRDLDRLAEARETIRILRGQLASHDHGTAAATPTAGARDGAAERERDRLA